MAESDFLIRMEREDGECLALAGLSLARAFFAGDPSAGPDGYDSFAGSGDPNVIVLDDVIAMNRTMRARSEHRCWEPVFRDEQRWLRRIPPNLDIVLADESEWEAANGGNLLSNAIAGCIQPGIGLASATKVLYLKRPKLVPVLDRLVAEIMGVNLPDNPGMARRVAVGQQLATAIRREARRNLDALRNIQEELSRGGIERPLIRILDAILWFSHPAASVAGASRCIATGLRD